MTISFVFLYGIGCVEPTPDPDSDPDSDPVPDTTTPTETERLLLHEVFTGSTCGPCFDAEGIILDLFEANPEQYVHLAYHVGGDPYTSAEAVSRRMYYVPEEMDTYSIPWLQVDGVHGFHPVEVNDDAGYLQEDFNSFAEFPSYVELQATHSITEQTVDITVTVLPLQDNSSTDLQLMVAIIENTTSLNEGTNGLTEFHHVMKKMLPDQNGTNILPLVRGEELEYSLSYTFQGEYDDSTGYSNPIDHSTAHTVEDFEDLSVVVFIQDIETKQVLQATWSE
jgi:hypothetical protein